MKHLQYIFKKVLNGFISTWLLAAMTILLFIAAEKVKQSTGIKFREIKEVPFTAVHFSDKFWMPRMEINRTVSIPSAFHQCEINGRFDNFALAGGLIQGEHKGDFPFDDTDPYKIIEGASYSLAVSYDAKLDAYLDSVISLIAAAQEPDGYLTTCVTNNCTRLSRWWGSSRWERLNSHELYNSGHLYEAAVAHHKATGKRSLLEVAIKNADLVCQVFGPGENQKHVPSGHPIIEMALVKLYKVTGTRKYLDMARYFVDETGRGTDGHRLSPYSQDHKPILEQDEIVGHAVRAGYLFSGVTDVAAMQQDTRLQDAVERIWENAAGKKLYITGGIGSRAQGEGFGRDYELNNFNSYCETCSSIANVYWNYRLFLATGDSKYIDVLERTLYNALLAGVSLSGDRFFYDNPLASHGVHQREPWFGCACCPGNVTRFVASVPGYVYATLDRNIYVNLFVEGHATINNGGNPVELSQKTAYPWEGDVEITINPAKKERFSLMVRIPGWAKNKPVPSDLYAYADNAHPSVTLSVNGNPVQMEITAGYAVIDRKWKAGDVVTLHLDMPVRRVRAHEAADYNRGLLAMERGPVVYALEETDQEHDFVFDLVIPRDAVIEPHFDAGLLNGVVVLEGNCLEVLRDPVTDRITEKPSRFKAIPYSTWNNRGPGQMVVWTPETAGRAIIKPLPSLASEAEAVRCWGVNDQFEPASSADINTPYHYWWLKNGMQEEAGYKFSKPERISSVEVYWLAFDHYDVLYRAPEFWKLLYKDKGEWKEVEATSPYGTEIDQYNKLTFKPVMTDELKMTVQLQRASDNNVTGNKRPQLPGMKDGPCSGGIIEWRVNP